MPNSTIESTQRALRNGDVSVAGLLEQTVAAMERYEPDYNAIICRREAAYGEAARMDRAMPQGPLAGVPIVIKDNVASAGPVPTTAGALALAGATARSQASVMTKLFAAGALVVAKTNLSEWANFRSSESSSGWSGVGGQTGNAHDPKRTPGGSSSGTAVAVALGYVPAGVGTETDGSIVIPAAMNGVVGFKPTVGLISRAGVVPISSTQDTAGPIARSVADAAHVAQALCGPDSRDAATYTVPGSALDLTRALQPGRLRGARLGVVRGYGGYQAQTDAVFESALGVLSARGAVIVDPVSLTPRDDIREHSRQVMLAEFAAGVNAYLADLPGDFPVRSLAAVIEFNERNPADAMPHFGQDLLAAAIEAPSVDTSEYRQAKARAAQLAGADGIDAALASYELDALVAPTTSTPWLIDHVNGDNRRGGCSTPAAVAGYPHITVPMGFVRGLPVGLSIFSRRLADSDVIAMAFDFEQASRCYHPPAGVDVSSD